MNLMHILENQDAVLATSFGTLVLMSIVSWSILLIRFGKMLGVKRRNNATIARFWAANDLQQVHTQLQGDSSVVASILQGVLPDYQQYCEQGGAGLQAELELKDYLNLNIRNRIIQRLRGFDGGLVTLASIGAVAPFVGLFGTVWGIFRALADIAQQGQVSIASVSGPIGEALVATALGLFVAIPAVLAYNAITRLNRNLSQDLDAFAHDLYVFLLNRKGA